MSADIDAAGSGFCPPERRVFVLIAAILASSMAFIDGSVVSIATPAIRVDLGATLSDAQWISNAYLLLLSALLLIGGAAGDRFGLRNVFSAGIVLFVFASLVCAIAPTPVLLIAARALQGAGAAFMVPGSLAIIAKAYPRNQRGRAIGIWAMASSLTTLLGPVLGGLVLTAFGDWSWRLVFAINLPLGAVALLLLLLQVPPDRASDTRRLDLIGGALATLGLLLLSYGLTAGEGGEGDGLGAPVRVGIAIGGALVLALFLVWEARAPAPMLPLRLFANLAFSGANGLTLALYFALSAFSFYLPMVLIAGWGVSPAEVAIALLPLGIALTLLSLLSGRLADRFGPAPLIAAGSTIVGLAFGGLALTVHLHALWSVLTPLVGVLGVGMGLVVSPLSTSVMTSVADTDTGTASGVNNATARIAGLLGVAIAGGLAAALFARGVGDAGTPLLFGLPPAEPLAENLEARRIAATDSAFAGISWLNAALSLVSALIAWTTLRSGRARAP